MEQTQQQQPCVGKKIGEATCAHDCTYLHCIASRELQRSLSKLQAELREAMHRLHVLCLVARSHIVNKRCLTPELQAMLLSQLPPAFMHTPYPDMSTAMELQRWLRTHITAEQGKDVQHLLHCSQHTCVLY
jgi:hypothetical protein